MQVPYKGMWKRMNVMELISFLESINGKRLLVKNSGYMACQTEIKNFNFYIEYNILTIHDKETENYVVVDLKRIKEIRKEKQEFYLTIYIDDEIETEVSIKVY